MTDKAILVGINAYPGAPLSGCVNDVTDMAEFLCDHAGFNPDSVRLLTDKRATTAAILERVRWLITGAKAGDRLVFHYSGHGAQVPTRDTKAEVDGLLEVICPVEFDWSPEHMITDKDFAKLFAQIPAGVKFLWISDSCHSGDLDRSIPHPLAPKSKSMPQPADIAWRMRSAAKKELVTASASRAALGKETPFPGVLISGCKSTQTSADAVFNGRASGALTYNLLKVLGNPQGMRESLTDVVRGVRSNLKQGGYSQVPQLEGKKAAFAKPFLG